MRIIGIGGLILLAAAIVYFRTLNLAEAGAYFGFLPTYLALPDVGGLDFPNGERELLKSLPMQIYPALGALGLSGHAIYVPMLFLEVVALVFGAIVATRKLNPTAIAASTFAVAICIVASNWLNSDL